MEKLRREKKLPKLKGMLYFTDGYGTFPTEKPSFETVFVFIDSYDKDWEKVRVPGWAMKVVLSEDEIF